MHLPVDSPYRSQHAVFVREGAEEPYDRNDEVPEVMRIRTLALRGFDASGFMVSAELIKGAEANEAFERLLAREQVAYVHAHYAAPGCFAARIDRVEV